MDKNESTPQPLGERSDENLVQLALELYARTCAHPSSKELHESAFAARDELVKRLRSVAGGEPEQPTPNENMLEYWLRDYAHFRPNWWPLIEEYLKSLPAPPQGKEQK